MDAMTNAEKEGRSVRKTASMAFLDVIALIGGLFLLVGGSVALTWHFAGAGWGILLLGCWAVVAICAAA